MSFQNYQMKYRCFFHPGRSATPVPDRPDTEDCYVFKGFQFKVDAFSCPAASGCLPVSGGAGDRGGKKIRQIYKLAATRCCVGIGL